MHQFITLDRRDVAERVLSTTQLSLGGTGLLIVVSVALETLRQLESRALMVTSIKIISASYAA